MDAPRRSTSFVIVAGSFTCGTCSTTWSRGLIERVNSVLFVCW